MRDIEFRGKDIEFNKWVHGSLIRSNDFYGSPREKPEYYICPFDTTFEYDECYHDSLEIDIKTVGQYTGLKDKNGTKIFEGDIVYCSFEDEYYKICWDDDDSKFSIHTLYDEMVLVFDFSHYFGKDFEVIGNIYDNPELLKGGA